jgi:DNA polymerase-3 subunit gamma/tau
MSNFIVSARKYRPVRFDEVVGQQHVSQTLKNALKNGHLAHAFLFCGPRGVGKTTCARILAKVINCENPTEDYEACNACTSCTSFNENASFNITELDAASNNSVEHIRALIEQVRFQPQRGRYKVFIIDEVHMLSQQAFNAFLKTLEEPPPYAIFILATTEKHKIIPTILSRCQIFDFRRIQVSDIVEHLSAICRQEGIEADSNALHIIAQKADGALRDALSIFDRIISFSGKEVRYQNVIDSLNILDYDYYFRITDTLLAEDYPSAMLILDEIIRKGFEPDLFINGLASHLRDLLVCKNEATLVLLEVSEDLRERYREQAALSPRSFLLTALQLAHDCDLNYKTAVNKRLHIELALLKMTYIIRMVEGRAVVEASAEKKTPEQTIKPQKPSETPPPPPPKAEKPAAPPSPSLKKEKQQPARSDEETQPEAARLQRSDRHSTPKLVSLQSLAQELSPEKEEEVPLQPLDEANVREAWNTYIETVQSKSAKTALQKASLEVKDEDKLVVTVSSNVSLNLIREENGLMDALREKLKRPGLILELKIDEKLIDSEAVARPPKPMTNKEKYEMMMEVNPLIQEIRKRFDLRLDQD